MAENVAHQDWPFVSVVLIFRNEEKFLGRCLDAIDAQDYPPDRYEVIAVDGGSSDQSLEILRGHAWRTHHKILSFARIVSIPEAMNIGIREAVGGIVIKMDAHGYPSENFIRGIVTGFQRGDHIGAVGGSIVQLGETRTGQSNAWARSSKFGVGGGPYTAGVSESFVNTVQCAGYRRSVLEEVGLFDEGIGLGEDEEVNWRIVKANCKILYTPTIQFFYYARPTLKGLFRQYLWYGDGRAVVVRKHPGFFRLKHVIPTLFVLSVGIGCAASITRLGWYFLATVLGLYTLASGIAAAQIARARGARYFPNLILSFAAIHFGYGIGFLRGILNYWVLKKPGRHRDLHYALGAGDRALTPPGPR